MKLKSVPHCVRGDFGGAGAAAAVGACGGVAVGAAVESCGGVAAGAGGGASWPNGGSAGRSAHTKCFGSAPSIFLCARTGHDGGSRHYNTSWRTNESARSVGIRKE